jgi:hypothetical protein
MADLIDKAMRRRRTLESALADLRAKCERHPTAALARMIEQLEAEIAARERIQSGDASG